MLGFRFGLARPGHSSVVPLPASLSSRGSRSDAVPIVAPSATPARTAPPVAACLAEERLPATEGAPRLRRIGAPFPRCPQGHRPRRGLRGLAPLRSAHKVPLSWTDRPLGAVRFASGDQLSSALIIQRNTLDSRPQVTALSRPIANPRQRFRLWLYVKDAAQPALVLDRTNAQYPALPI